MTARNERSQSGRTAGFEDADTGGVGENDDSTAIAYSRGFGKSDNTPSQRIAADFDSFREAILADRGESKGQQWISGPFRAAGDDSIHNASQSKAAAIGMPHRCKDCALSRTWLAFDVDGGLTAESFWMLVALLQSFQGIAWTTHSHKDNAPRCRIVLALDLPAPRAEHIAACQVMRGRIDAQMLAAGYEKPKWDSACDRPEQPIYLPPVDGRTFQLDGEPVALGELLANVEHVGEPGPSVQPPLGVVITEGDSYAVAALNRAVQTIAATSPGERNHVLNREAFSMGGFAGAGRLSREQVVEAFDMATLDWADPEKTRGTIRGAVASGAAKPRFDHLPASVGRADKNHRRRLEFTAIGDLMKHDLRPHWLIKGLLEQDCLALVYGVSGGGKSFYVLDAALCVATATPFFGHNVTAGPVLYIAGEGARGLQRRAVAWAVHHSIDIGKAPLFISSGPTQMLNNEAMDELLQTVADFTERHGSPVLIIIDTVSRNFGAGNENATDDMVKFVAGCDALRQQTGGCVIGVHHVSKANPDVARGSGVLRAALDWEYACVVAGEKVLEVRCMKSKDFDAPPPATYRIHGGIDIGAVDDDGEPITSAVLVPAFSMQPAQKGKAGRGKNQTAALRALNELTEQTRQRLADQGITPDVVWVQGIDWREWCLDVEKMPRQRFAEVARTLEKEGLVVVDCDRVRLGDGFSDRTI